ncbi:MAG TPA: hypothetical protein VMZ53_12440, partial [Kofleriaceae bacterium]|nr:hypothetical protein [Kofleriaceae bacterium]
ARARPPDSIPPQFVAPSPPVARRIPLALVGFALAFVGLVLDAGGGPGWGEASARAVLATQQRHLATSPLYDVLANIAALLLPAGEPGFRLGVLAALLGAATLAGITAAVRALVPKEPAAALAPIALLAITPAFREAAAFPTPALLAACGAAWSLAFAIRFARSSQLAGDSSDARDARDAISALACCAIVVGSAPYLGAVWTVVMLVWLARSGAARSHLAICVGAIGLFVVVLWVGARGELPGIGGASLAATLAATGRGPAAIVVGAGLLGVGFGALTKMPHARWLACFVGVASLHAAVDGGTGAAGAAGATGAAGAMGAAAGAAVVLVCVLAIGVAILPAAIVRVVANDGSAMRRNAIAALAAVPLVGVALATGAMVRVDDPGGAPTQLARDLENGVPPGPGTFVTTRATSFVVLEYESVVAGRRPDLALVPPLPSREADAIVANALRGDRIAAADAAAFGRLDIRRAIPRRRGFQLVGEAPEKVPAVEGPATYATEIGEQEATLLAVERARFEAASDRLDGAARAAGLAGTRFHAADLAVLAATTPVPERPAFFGLLPHDPTSPPGPSLLELFGDDLAWVAGLPIAPVAADAPMPRRLHEKWRGILAGTTKLDDPAIAAMGPDAVRATHDVFDAK